MNVFLKWWLIIVLSVIGSCVSIYFDFDKFLYENDLTKLSLVILLFFTISSIIVGYKIYKQFVEKVDTYTYETEWFVSEILVSLGMIGTVIGFIYMLYTVFGNLDETYYCTYHSQTDQDFTNKPFCFIGICIYFFYKLFIYFITNNYA